MGKLSSICSHSSSVFHYAVPSDSCERTVRYQLGRCDWEGPIFGLNVVVKVLYLEDLSVWCIPGNALKVEGVSFSGTGVTLCQFTARRNPENRNLYKHRCENSNDFTLYFVTTCSVRWFSCEKTFVILYLTMWPCNSEISICGVRGGFCV
jgi:hypothetical protein